jgi:hypothetical protein
MYLTNFIVVVNIVFIVKPLEWNDQNLWHNLAMLKLAIANEDQCPAQCNEKYKQTHKVIGVHDSFISTVGKLLNETDDIIQGMESSEFEEDLKKYQDVSELIREVFNIFMEIPKTNRQMAKMMMKLIKLDNDGGKHNGQNHPRPRPKPRSKFGLKNGDRPNNKPIGERDGRYIISYLLYLLNGIRYLCLMSYNDF